MFLEETNWFASNICCNPGSGNDIEFWRNKWCGIGPLCDLFTQFISYILCFKAPKSCSHLFFDCDVTKNLIWLVSVWCIWSIHNKIIFQSEVKDINTIVISIKTLFNMVVKWRTINLNDYLWSNKHYIPISTLLLIIKVAFEIFIS